MKREGDREIDRVTVTMRCLQSSQFYATHADVCHHLAEPCRTMRKTFIKFESIDVVQFQTR